MLLYSYLFSFSNDRRGWHETRSALTTGHSTEGDDYIVLGLGVGILGVYWLAVHFLDKWTIDLLPWWVEPFTAIPLVGLLALTEVFGKNPLHWWPLVWGTKIQIRQDDDPIKHSLEIDEIKERLGGPLNVYVIDWQTLKFRRMKDVTKYLLFKF